MTDLSGRSAAAGRGNPCVIATRTVPINLPAHSLSNHSHHWQTSPRRILPPHVIPPSVHSSIRQSIRIFIHSFIHSIPFHSSTIHPSVLSPPLNPNTNIRRSYTIFRLISLKSRILPCQVHSYFRS